MPQPRQGRGLSNTSESPPPPSSSSSFIPFWSLGWQLPASSICQIVSYPHKQWTCLALLLLHFPCADCKSSPWSMSLTSSPMDVMSLWYIERERNWERREGRVSCLICCLVFEKKMMVDGFSPPNQNNCSLLAMQWPVWILPLVTVWNDNGSLLVFFWVKRFWFSPLKTDIKTEMSKSRPLVSDTVF